MDILVTFLMTKKNLGKKVLQKPQALWEIHSWEANLKLSENWFVNRNCKYWSYFCHNKEGIFSFIMSDILWAKMAESSIKQTC